MKKIIKHAIKYLETFISIKNSFVVVGAFMISTFLNYGFQVVSGRYLGSIRYGLMAGLLSIMSITTVACSAIQVQTVKALSRERPYEPLRFIDAQFRDVTKISFIGAIFIGCTMPFFSRFWSVGILPLLIISAYVVPASWDSISAGRFQGESNFTGLAKYSLLQSSLKGLALALVIFAGLGVTGLVLFVTVATTFGAIIGFRKTKVSGALTVPAFDRETQSIFFVNTLLWLMLSMDVIVAKNVLGDAAGKYAAASTIAKAALWMPSLVTQVVLPHLAKQDGSGLNTNSDVRKSMLITVVIATAACAVLSLIGPLLIKVMYGASFEGAGEGIWKLCLGLLPFSLAQLMVSVHFIRGNRFLPFVMLAMCLFEAVLLIKFCDSLASFAGVIGLTGVLLSIFLIAFRETIKP